MTGDRPNLSKLCVFGCPVTVEKITRRRTKTSNNTSRGIFLWFANTFESCKYIDNKTKKVKTARIKPDKFDEAIYTSKDPPPGGRALIKAGMPQEMSVQQTQLPINIITKDPQQSPTKKLRIKLTEPEATPPLRATNGPAGYDMFSCDTTTISPGEQAIISTGVSMTLPTGT